MSARPRSRDLGLRFGDLPSGPHDAITDVGDVRVGSVTLIEGEGALRPGSGPVRTGVTVLVPHGGHVWDEPLFAGCHRLNGNGEMTGLEWIREAGRLTSPIGLTNTHSVGVVRDALVAAGARGRRPGELYWSLPVVAETWDGMLNDINGFHVRAEHVHEALARATAGPVAEGAVGSGTGMICHGFKGGLGTASRVVAAEHGGYTVGVLVQANHGRRERLTVAGAPVGRYLGPEVVPLPAEPAGGGSIIVVCATDAPLLPHQCTRLAQRASLGIARAGGLGEHWSGDLLLAFSTARQEVPSSEYARSEPVTATVTMLVDSHLDALFAGAVEATEAAIVNALLAAETMTGRDGVTAHALTAELLVEALERARRDPTWPARPPPG
jgi:D-aminopeptidase